MKYLKDNFCGSLKNLQIHPKYRSRVILGNLIFRSGKRLYQEMSINYPEFPNLDPERYFIDLRRKRGWIFMMTAFLISSLRMTMSGRWAAAINRKPLAIPDSRSTAIFHCPFRISSAFNLLAFFDPSHKIFVRGCGSLVLFYCLHL